MVRSIPQLERLREDWDALAARFASPVLDHDWFLSCAEAFHADTALRISITRHAGEVTGIAPHALEPDTGGTRLRLLGVSRLYEPSGWLFRSDRDLAGLVEDVVRQRHPIALQRIDAGSPVCAAVLQLSRRRALTTSRPTRPSLGIAIRGPWADYYGTLSTRITENLARLQRRAERTLGPMRVEHSIPSPEDAGAALERFIAIEASGWKGRRGSSLRDRPDLHDFFRRYSQRAAARRRLRISSLRFGGQLAAMEISVDAYDRMWQLKIGYNDALSQFYPGLQLTRESIRSAFERGVQSYEFLGAAASWEERWRPEARPYRLLLAYPLSARGVVGACTDIAGTFWRRSRRGASS